MTYPLAFERMAASTSAGRPEAEMARTLVVADRSLTSVAGGQVRVEDQHVVIQAGAAQVTEPRALEHDFEVIEAGKEVLQAMADELVVVDHRDANHAVFP
ncbi:hypothetical protein ABT120_32310 [Nonomuraea angiospora]|uniref:hypothetical protein n=1 Tax=Nonomuraea angiospora TaxID=46172 RepID=UPI003327516C